METVNSTWNEEILWKATALKRWTIIESRWNSRLVSLESPEIRVRLRFRSDMKAGPMLFMGTRVSRPMEQNHELQGVQRHHHL